MSSCVACTCHACVASRPKPCAISAAKKDRCYVGSECRGNAGDEDNADLRAKEKKTRSLHLAVIVFRCASSRKKTRIVFAFDKRVIAATVCVSLLCLVKVSEEDDTAYDTEKDS